MGVGCSASPPPKPGFFELIGEPGHTEPKAARLRRGRKLEVLLSEWALLSTLTAGLPTLRKIGNPSFQPLFLRCRDRLLGKSPRQWLLAVVRKPVCLVPQRMY